ncbi:dTDP-4-dehydrorhamnose reductase [Clostridium botulinum]|uniref:dTDP-4-dehydrorhamnose reductase n=1 Tax=Clostridium botulinum TaxID=1491 RepID=A0A846JTX8_CLOBO|nr:dTDP-4-dehydrorhamnose reductase [Clostridium botulinum]KOM87530.1 dTDP-4-dehydrorhamnose reductase [Clostridium botulinum]KOR61537.1 dTDP-4-dehydrorhamnose reductase [Clostridium botulinum]NFE59991.1 dTDP-4-dehydrorhamnose reductase [Clostridium botulinum]NFE94647.1 dTDP-4-dehydrorhamnose reductase [Clostridium botulinum]NFG11362.1 dTDP-4-dehydrorhamnose reductase [Clostridium botulinum]
MILVTGANGQLGYDVIKELKKRNIECIGTTRKELDITNYNEVSKYIEELKPKCVIHCAAYTAVDKAQDEEEICTKVNVYGTENIAKVCRRINAKIIYISSDYVFDGAGDKPHEIEETPNPLSVYGSSKYNGELKVKSYLKKYFIVRTSWVFGLNGSNFVKTMLKLGKEKESLNVVCDQIGSPTYTEDLAKLLCDMAVSEKYGIYHATNQGFCSWAEFAEEIMRIANLNCKINYISTNEYKTKAIRPLNSRLSKKSLLDNGFNELSIWKSSLKVYIGCIVLHNGIDNF